jgi:hypothetical protein
MLAGPHLDCQETTTSVSNDGRRGRAGPGAVDWCRGRHRDRAARSLAPSGWLVAANARGVRHVAPPARPACGIDQLVGGTP